jgi:glutamine amidotransferase
MSEPIYLVDLGLGNLGSVTNMLTRAGVQVQRISEPAALADASKLILPGVGSFDAMVQKLDAAGLRQPILEHVRQGKHLLGICLGMQLLSEGSDEGKLAGLGLIPGRVRRFCFKGDLAHLKVPHMGWNRVQLVHPHPLGQGLEDGARFYFVHSYHGVPLHPDHAIATTDYGIPFTCAVRHHSIRGVQFHPERSQEVGLQLLKNFCDMKPVPR